jgi:hypothetical protein
MRRTACFLAAFVVACGGSSGPGFEGGSSGGNTSSGSGGSGSSGSGAGGSSGSGFGGSGSSSGITGGNGCSGQAADYVYVLSAENDLYSFAPAQKVFTKIGALGCQTTMKPNSMAVDRNAVAWVNYVQSDNKGNDTAGAIYQVSTKDASCEATPTVTLPTGWYRIGMGYSTQGSSTSETLYIAGTGNAGGGGGTGLGEVTGTSTMNLGMFTGMLAGQNAELTGTGDGRLFGFFTTIPTVQVAQIQTDSTKGAPGTIVSQTPMTGVLPPTDWAFSFWGGHFYLYTSLGIPAPIGMGSNVADYDPVSGSIDTTYMQNIGFDIVGAGVSTCAPVTPPQ